MGEHQQVSALSATCLRLWGQIKSKLVAMATEHYMHLLTDLNNFSRTFKLAGRASVLAWHASGPKFDPHVRHILSCRFGCAIISTAILSLPLIQEEQLSLTSYW